MKLKISTEEDNFLTIIADLRACGHTGLSFQGHNRWHELPREA